MYEMYGKETHTCCKCTNNQVGSSIWSMINAPVPTSTKVDTITCAPHKASHRRHLHYPTCANYSIWCLVSQTSTLSDQKHSAGYEGECGVYEGDSAYFDVAGHARRALRGGHLKRARLRCEGDRRVTQTTQIINSADDEALQKFDDGIVAGGLQTRSVTEHTCNAQHTTHEPRPSVHWARRRG